MDTYQISPRVAVRRGEPVRITGKRGLYRFVAADPDTKLVAVIGPFTRTRNAPMPLQRTFASALVRSAGRATATDVETHPEIRALNARAHANRRKR